LLPRKIAYFIGDRVADLVFLFAGKLKDIALKSLDIIFRDRPLPERERLLIVKRAFYSMVHFGIDFLKLRDFNASSYERFAVLEGYENIERGLSGGRGLVVVTLHMGNWDYLGGVPALLGNDVAVIINRQFNPFTDAWIKKRREKYTKMKNYYNEVGDIKRVISHIKNGGIVAFVTDQTYYFKPLFVPFFGIGSATADGPARFHLQFGAPIMMAYSIRLPGGRYLLKYDEAVSFTKTGDIHKDCEKIMTWVNSRYEEYIRKYPDQWFSLFHGRWVRTRPEDFRDCEWDPY
jgi:KDO2-lipid IV(A) lauroyltransferase